MKLYPPIIEGTIPAFYGNEIRIPYEMNKAISRNEINGFSLKFKTVQSNRYLGDTQNFVEKNGDLIFTVPENIYQYFTVGEFYKVQLAYINKTDNTIGYYSTVGVVKYTSNPTVTILNSTDGTTFTGIYNQKDKDITEKVYSYRFDLMDSSGNIFETSGEQIHNNSFDTEIFESIDRFTIVKELQRNKVYYLTYTITTINGLVKSSAPKKLTKTDSIDSKLRTKLVVKLNYEDGYVDLRLAKPEEDVVEQSAVGSFMLLRASDEDNYSSWNEVLRFVLYGQQPSRHLWKDTTVKQGVNYKYAIQQYNEHGLKTNKIESDIVFVDFEHAYLSDGKRQLKIKYNPKVSSFKNTLLESKVDTIGSKYPIIFRNGNVKYKEFPISGMISYLSDDNNLFLNIFDYGDLNERPDNKHDEITIVNIGPITKDNYLEKYSTYYINKIIKNPETNEIIDEYLIPWKQYLNDNYPNVNILEWNDVQLIINEAFRKRILYENFRQQQYLKYSFDKKPTTDLTSYNTFIERNFKLEVLDWLTNGEPKLFRSPVEGNYLVRLLNVSMSPQDPLGRMLHTFNCTAYEIADYTYNNLAKYGIITTTNPTVEQLRWQTIQLPTISVKDGQNLLSSPAAAIKFEGMIPGDKLYINDGIIRNGENGYNIIIGATGSYIIDLKNNVRINEIYFESSPDYVKDENGGVRHQGILTYGYYTTDFKDSFDTVNAIDVKQMPTRQFIGNNQNNIIESINNIKQQLSSIGYVRFYLRESDEELCKVGSNYYSIKMNGSNIYADKSINPKASSSLYKVYTNKLANGSFDKDTFIYYDGYNDKTIEPLKDDHGVVLDDHSLTTIIFNEENKVDLWDIYAYDLKLPTDIDSIKIGDGVICEITYQYKEITYDIEESVDYVKIAKNNYMTAEKEYFNLIKNQNVSLTEILNKQKVCDTLYNEFLNKLTQAIAEAERR